MDLDSGSAGAIPTAFHTVDYFFLQFLPFLLFGHVIVSLLPPLTGASVQHPAALSVPHLVVEAVGAGKQINMLATLCNFALF